MRKRYNLVVMFLVALALVLVSNMLRFKQHLPEKPIEYIVPWAAGGGSDIMARTIAEILRNTTFCRSPLSW